MNVKKIIAAGICIAAISALPITVAAANRLKKISSAGDEYHIYDTECVIGTSINENNITDSVSLALDVDREVYKSILSYMKNAYGKYEYSESGWYTWSLDGSYIYLRWNADDDRLEIVMSEELYDVSEVE